MDRTPLIVVSSDTHIGPRLTEDLRPYCPSALLRDFDEFSAAWARRPEAAGSSPFSAHPNMRTAGHYDVHQRLRDLDRDGVACEVVFHGSQNDEPIPFVGSSLGNQAALTLDLRAAASGCRIYNAWLADICSVEPFRHVGLAQLPMWDVEQALAELEVAVRAGLRGVNLPPMRHGLYLEYNDRAWEPFWAACEDWGMTLATHVGAASPGNATGPERMALTSIEDGGYFARRAVWWLIFGGVFERHPKLKLVITESPGTWWTYTMDELDSVWSAQGANAALRSQVPRPPSEYAREHVYVGASFLAAFEALDAVEKDY